MTASYSFDLIGEARRAFGEGVLATPHRTAHAANTVCGDEVDLDLAGDGGHILDVAHRTRGCVFTRASASILARVVRGRAPADALALGEALRRDIGTSAALPTELAQLAEVRVYPARLRCVLLPWDALRLALDEA